MIQPSSCTCRQYSKSIAGPKLLAVSPTIFVLHTYLTSLGTAATQQEPRLLDEEGNTIVSGARVDVLERLNRVVGNES